MLVAGHVPGLGDGVAVHRGSGLDALAEGHHPLRAVHPDGLDDVRPLGKGRRGGLIAQQLKDPGGKGGGFDRLADRVRGHEEALVEGLVAARVGAHLPADAGGGQAGGDPLDGPGGSGQIGPGRGQAAADVLDQAAHGHVRAQLRGLLVGQELPVAVVHHQEDVRPDPADGVKEGLHPLGQDGGPPGVAPAALHQDHPGLGPDGRKDGGDVDLPVRRHIHRGKGNAHFFERPGRVPGNPDHLVHGIIGLFRGGQKVAARGQQAEQAHGKGVGAGRDLGADDRLLRVEQVGKQPFQGIPPGVVIAVAGGGGKVPQGDVMLLKQGKHAAGVAQLPLFQGGKNVL